MSDATFNSVESALAAKAGNPPAPGVEQAIASNATPSEIALSIEQDDHVGAVLQHLPLSVDLKADLWDAATTAQSPDDLARSLKQFDIPPHVAASLIVAKRLLDTEHPEPSDAEKVKAAAQQMSQIDPKLLDILEAHPTVLKHLLAEPKS